MHIQIIPWYLRIKSIELGRVPSIGDHKYVQINIHLCVFSIYRYTNTYPGTWGWNKWSPGGCPRSATPCLPWSAPSCLRPIALLCVCVSVCECIWVCVCVWVRVCVCLCKSVVCVCVWVDIKTRSSPNFFVHTYECMCAQTHTKPPKIWPPTEFDVPVCQDRKEILQVNSAVCK